MNMPTNDEWIDKEMQEFEELERRLGRKLNPILKPMPNPLGTTFLWVLLTKRNLRKAIIAEIVNARRVL